MKFSEFIFCIQNHAYFPKYSKWIFAVLLLIFSIIYNYHNILFKSSQSIHQWRQCDCLSITMNYYQDNNPFLEPAVHNLEGDGTGKAISECPVLYYSIASLWKAFGYHEFFYRLIVLLFLFTGLFLIFKVFESTLKDSILSMISALFLFTSPTLIYYANNFLMDIPAFSLALIGLYFFFKFEQSTANKHLYWFAFFYAIAGLLKISSLLSFFAIFSLLVLELFKVKLNPDRRIFKYPIKQTIVFIGVIFVQIIWYTYAHKYNTQHHSENFLIGILPIWDMSLSEIKTTIHAINDHIKWDYFRKETQIIFLLIFTIVLAFHKKVNKLILLLTIITSVGFLAYILLFFYPLKEHDYYTINLFILVPIILFAFLRLLKNQFNFIYTSLVFRGIVIAFLIHNVDFARRRISGRYNPEGWQNSYYITNIRSFGEISPYLRSLGINKEDRVISLSDNSINISLYLMNQKGWTNYGINTDSLKIRQRIEQGAKYLLISDIKTYDEQSVKPFITNKIGQFNNIDIYKLINTSNNVYKK